MFIPWATLRQSSWGWLFLALLLAGIACAPGAQESADGAAPAPGQAGARDGAVFTMEDRESSGADSLTERLIVRQVEMTLVVTKVQETLLSISQLAQDSGGFVVTSSISGEDAATVSAIVVIRIPVEQLDTTLDSLRAMAVRVPSEQSSAQDVTEEYVDLQARLANLEATEARLAQLLDRAETVDDVLKVDRELSRVRGEIESLKGRIQYLERTSSTSRIAVQLLPQASEKPLTDPTWAPLETARNALRQLTNAGQTLADTAIWIAVFSVLWLPVILLVGWLAWRRRHGPSTARSSE